MARLIVNADDLGLTRGINRAILKAHRDGIVTSATLMANAIAFDEAVALARDADLAVGCHIVLVDGTPLSAPTTISTLLKGSAFRKKLWHFAAAAVFGGISVEHVEREATAQIEKVQAARVEVSHVDCHKHAHMFPTVLEGVIRAAKKTGVPAIRNPFEPKFARRVSGGGTRALETATLYWMFADSFREEVAEARLQTTGGSVGVTATGSLDAETFARLVAALPREGVYEFVCHPGYNDDDLASAGTRLLGSRETELSILCSREARRQLAESAAELTNYRKLCAANESKPAVSHPMP